MIYNNHYNDINPTLETNPYFWDHEIYNVGKILSTLSTCTLFNFNSVSRTLKKISFKWSTHIHDMYTRFDASLESEPLS